MILPTAFSLGSASHTGHVRLNNEDDYLLGSLVPPNGELLLCAVADGMGGVAGGAEASRTALRALGSAVLDAASRETLEKRLAAGYRAAAQRVFEQAEAVPALAEMGTTLTVLCLSPGHAAIGHIGDTRLYRVRSHEVEALTVDHAVAASGNLLTRCIGGGQAGCEPDLATIETRAGDRFVLVSDGVWGVLPAPEIDLLFRRDGPQDVAEALVAAALAAGGPDNATAVVVDVLSGSASPAGREEALQREERPDARAIWPRSRSLRPPAWPWLTLTAAILLVIAAALRWWWGWDPFAWLQRVF